MKVWERAPATLQTLAVRGPSAYDGLSGCAPWRGRRTAGSDPSSLTALGGDTDYLLCVCVPSVLCK